MVQTVTNFISHIRASWEQSSPKIPPTSPKIPPKLLQEIQAWEYFCYADFPRALGISSKVTQLIEEYIAPKMWRDYCDPRHPHLRQISKEIEFQLGPRSSYCRRILTVYATITSSAKQQNPQYKKINFQAFNLNVWAASLFKNISEFADFVALRTNSSVEKKTFDQHFKSPDTDQQLLALSTYLTHIDDKVKNITEWKSHYNEEEQKIRNVPAFLPHIGRFKGLSEFSWLSIDQSFHMHVPLSLFSLKIREATFTVYKYPRPLHFWSHLTSLEVRLFEASALLNEIAKCKNLKTLSLSEAIGTQPFKIPSDISNLQQLEFASFKELRLPGLPKEIGKCQQLRRLEIYEKQQPENFDLPDEICDLENLSYLKLENLELKNLPAEMGKLKQLNTLLISNNKITNLPDSLQNAKDLWLIEAYHNPMKSPQWRIDYTHVLDSSTLVILYCPFYFKIFPDDFTASPKICLDNAVLDSAALHPKKIKFLTFLQKHPYIQVGLTYLNWTLVLPLGDLLAFTINQIAWIFIVLIRSLRNPEAHQFMPYLRKAILHIIATYGKHLPAILLAPFRLPLDAVASILRRFKSS